jgi:predicted ester cyclase
MSDFETIEKNKAFYRRFLQEIFNEGRVEHLEDFVSSIYILHGVEPGAPQGIEGIRQGALMFLNAFTDWTISVDALIGEGDLLAGRFTGRGVHTGTFLGLAPTGRSVIVNSQTMVRITDGRLCESWVRNDVMGLMKQLEA